MSEVSGVGARRHFSVDEEDALRRDESTTTEALCEDKKGLATLQLHADRGMHAARDLLRSGMTVEAFFSVNPKVAEAYKKDAAFREGFDAYLWAKANLPREESQKLDAKLEERDGWYAQAQVSVRV